MLMSFMSCSIIVAWHENRGPSSIASGEHSPTLYIFFDINHPSGTCTNVFDITAKMQGTFFQMSRFTRAHISKKSGFVLKHQL